MLKKLAPLFSLFLLCTAFLEEKHELFEVYAAEGFYLKYLYFSSCILILAIIRHVVMTYEIPVPYAIFCVLVGMLWGVGSAYSEWMLKVGVVAQSERIKTHFADIYLAIIVFTLAFIVDVHTFVKSLAQIVVIAVPVSLLSTAMIGLFMRLVIDSSWSKTQALIFGLLLLPTYPVDVIYLLKASSVQNKYVSILLQGEALLTAGISEFFVEILLGSTEGFVVHWYQHVMLTLRAVICSVPLGFFFGSIGVSFMKLTYNEPSLLILLTVSICFVSYFVTHWCCSAGAIATMICGVRMSSQRKSLPNEVEHTVVDTWKMFAIVMNSYMFITAGDVAVTAFRTHVYLKEYIIICVTYMAVNIARFLSFFCFSPILSRIGYGMSFQNMVICVWSGLKNPVALALALDASLRTEDAHTAKLNFLHTLGVFVLMLLINGTFLKVLLRALGLWEISLTRQTTMNNCLKVIYEARNRTLAILKMDRFLSDANWPLVMTSTSLKHPYKKTATEGKENENEEEDFVLGYKYTYCPDCQKHIPNEPTRKEMKEMTKEAKLRILKFKKTVYSRLYENGMISRDGVRILHQAVEIAMDTKEAIIELDGLLRLFDKEGVVYKYLQGNLQRFFQMTDDSYKLPRRKWRIWCNRVVNHRRWFIFINLVVFSDVVFSFIYMWMERKSLSDSRFLVINAIFCSVYIFEFFVKIFAHRHGVKIFFSYFWNWVKFLIMLTAVTEIIIEEMTDELKKLFYIHCIYISLLLLRLSRVIIRLKLVSDFLRPIPTTLLKYLDTQANKHKILAFELGKNYIAAEQEILENLHQIVDNDKIRRNMKDHTEADIHALSRKLGISQKNKPWVASTVKTRASMSTVLNSMKDDIEELKVSGWVDDVEYHRLLNSLSERYKYISGIKLVQPSAPSLIFREVPYMNDNETLINFLYENVSTKKFDPGDVVFEEGQPVDGVYILITGMFLVDYRPSKNVTAKLNETGALPVIDYLCSMSYDEPVYQYFIPGNTIGELSTMTGRPYDGTITAETHSEVFFLTVGTVKKAIEMDPDPVNGFECRIWKTVAFRIAVNVLTNVPSYRSYTQENICYLLERSFMPNLSNYKVFVVNDMMQDIILIEGIVVDFNTREVYTAPCYIPRAVEKLILPRSSAINIEIPVETKLLIIPAKDFDEYEIMLNEEETSELLNAESAKCLRHLIQDKAEFGSKSSRQKGLNIAKQIRKKLQTASSMSGKSKITFSSPKSSAVEVSPSAMSKGSSRSFKDSFV